MKHIQGPLDSRDKRALVRADDPLCMLSSLRTLARAMLSVTESGDAAITPSQLSGGDRRKWGNLAHEIYRQRRRRADFFPTNLFGEPAWDTLLDLYYAAESNELRSIKASCLSSNVPEATALRYIAKLTDMGLAEHRADKTDRRRKFLRLTPLGQRKMKDYFSALPPLGDHGMDVIRFLATQK